MNLMPLLRKRSNHDSGPTTDVETLEERKQRLDATPKNGPRSMRHVTNGQLRRRAIRDMASQQRKANRSYRRQWFADQQTAANERGRTAVLEGRTSATPAMVANVQRDVIRKTGVSA